MQEKTPPPHSQLTSTLEIHLGELLAEHERQMELDREKADLISDAVHDLRGSITSLNLRIYMLEHSSPEDQAKYLDSLKDSVAELTKMASDILAKVRQESKSDV